MRQESDHFRGLLVMAAIGSYLLWSAGAAIPLLRLDLGISRTLAGAHNVAVGIAATLGARLALLLVTKFGREWVIRGMLLLMFIGVMGVVLGNSIWLTIPSVAVAAYSQTTVNAVSLAQISLATAPSMRRMMLQTGIQALVGASAILLISASLQADLGWRLPIILGALLLTPISLFSIWRVKFIIPPPAQNSPERRLSKRLQTRLISYGAVNSVIEMGVGFWAIDLLINRNAPVALGALGSALLSYGIAASRLGLAFFHVKSALLNRLSLLLIISGVLIICFADNPLITMLGLIIAALGTAPLFALGAFRVSEGFTHADYRISRYMMGAAFSYGFAPFALAIVFDNFGYAIGYSLLMPVAVAGYLLWKINGPKEAEAVKK